MNTQFYEKEILILSLIEYICDKEKKTNNVLNKIYDMLVNKNLVSYDIVNNGGKKNERINFVKKFLSEINDTYNIHEFSDETNIHEFSDETNIHEFSNETNIHEFSNEFNDKTNSLCETDHIKQPNKIINFFENTIFDKLFKNNVNIDYSKTLIKSNTQCFQNFIKIGIIGAGGFGQVYKVFSVLDGGIYAVKKILIDTKYKDIDYYLNEVRILAKLNHPNVIRYYSTWIELKYQTIDIETSECDKNSGDKYEDEDEDEDKDEDEDEDEDEENSLDCIYSESHGSEIIHFNNKSSIPNGNILYIQMELCDMTLKQYLQERNNIDINLNKNVIIQLAEAIIYIRDLGIMHQDITPQNIFIKFNKSQNNPIIKLADFGLSFEIKNKINKTSKSIANSLYLPDQINYNNNDIINKSIEIDIYSLGVICYELFNKFNTGMERVINLNKLKEFSRSKNINYYCDHVTNSNIEQVIKEDITNIDDLYVLKQIYCIKNHCNINILINMLNYTRQKSYNIDTFYNLINYNIMIDL